MRKLVGTVLTPLCVIALATSANAQTISNQATGLSNPAATITFDGLGNRLPVTDQYASLGVTFSGVCSDQTSNFVNTGPSLLNFSGSCGTSQIFGPFDIFFTQAVYGAAFNARTNTGTSVFTAFLNGVQVLSFSAATFNTTSPGFYGFDESVVLDRIYVQPGGSNQAMAIDNLQVGHVTPEPMTWTLLGSGLAGLALLRRRKRNSSASI